MKGNEEALCIYIDIKLAYNSLPLDCKYYVNRKYIQQDKSIQTKLANKGIRMMEDFLNGR